MTGPERGQYRSTLKYIRQVQEARNVFQKFLDDGSQKLGYVFAGSGLYKGVRRPDGTHRLSDWALINIFPGRLGTSESLHEQNKVRLRYFMLESALASNHGGYPAVPI